MRAPFRRAPQPPAQVLARAPLADQKVLAHAPTGDGGWLLGTRDALLSVGVDHVVRLPWERVEAADWDSDTNQLRVTEVGEPGPAHTFALDDPRLLLQLVRERVTASVLLQRRSLVSGKRGVTVIARKAPRRNGTVTFSFRTDRGLDPDDPAVVAATERAVREAREELGLAGEPI